MNHGDKEKLVDTALHQLGEHFSAVQILVSWQKEGDGGTLDLFSGTGNWYARQGMAHEFIRRDNAQVHARELRQELKSGDET